MNRTARAPLTAHVPAVSEPVAGVIAGVVAGVAYLAAQVTLTAAAPTGSASAPLQRIAAILMGPNAAPPPSEFNFTVLGMAIIIHFALAMVFGRLVSALVWRQAAPRALGVGILTGIALYALNFELIAPWTFPWFEQSLTLVTLADHALFGLVAAAVCIVLRGKRST